MKTELNLLGKRFNMAPRKSRRWLVVMIYTGYLTCLVGAMFIDQRRLLSILVLIGLTQFLCVLTLRRSVKRFHSNGLDERDLRWRDRAHYYSYRTVLFLIVLILVAVIVQREQFFQSRSYLEIVVRNAAAQQWMSIMTMPLRRPNSTDDILLVLVFLAIFLATTLPEALVLWFQPDLESVD